MGVVTLYMNYPECVGVEEALRQEFPWIKDYFVQRFPPGKLGERVVIVPDTRITDRAELERKASELTKRVGVKVTILSN